MNTCPAPRFPFLEPTSHPTTPVPALLPTDHEMGAVASGLGLLFLQQPQILDVFQQLQQQLEKYIKNTFFKRKENSEKKKPKEGVLLIQACRDADEPTWHRKAVQQVFTDTLARYQSPTASKQQPVQMVCVNKDKAIPIQNPKAYLHQLIDAQFTTLLSDISKIIAKQGDDGQDVISLSTGGFRTHSYIDVQKALAIRPDWFAPLIGLSPNTIYTLKHNAELLSKADSTIDLSPNDIDTPEQQKSKRQINAELLKKVNDSLNKVNSAIVRYVDAHLDQPNSPYNQFKTQYRKIIQEAVKRGIAVVVPTGDEHLNALSFKAKSGADTNFLLEADGVIGVGASDDNRTASFHDDTVAPFSSIGNGEDNPIILAPGIGVKVDGKRLNGSGVSASQVAAIIRAMRQRYPNLRVEEIIDILQQTAVKTKDHHPISHGAGVVNPQAAIIEAERRGKLFSLSN
jgi:hypothetical protein